MDTTALRSSIYAAVQLSFSRAGGPGGQNVNKANTKVEARIALSALCGLSEQELSHLRNALANRISAEDELIVVASEERTQGANRERALSRLEALIVSAARIPKKRRKTKPTRSSIEKRLESKRLTSGIKRARKAKHTPED